MPTSTASLPPLRRSSAPSYALSALREKARRLTPLDWNYSFLPDYFGNFDPADFHADLADVTATLHLARGSKHSRIAPRGGAKSTWWTLAYPLRAALEGWEPYTLILSDSSSQADQHLDNIKKEIEDNPLIRAVYQRESGAGPEWNQSRIRLRNGALIEALGTGKKVRGRRNRAERPSLVIFDDIQSNEDVASPVLRERAWQWATREVIPAGDERTNFLAVGSALHREAVSVKLGQLAGWSGRTHRAVHHWPDRMDLWAEFERLATNLADDEREETARAFYAANRAAMDAGAVVYWPERFPIVELMLRRAAIGSDAFESEYNGVPGSVQGAEWPSELFDRPGFMFDQWPDDIVLTIQSLDPSKGTTDKSDYQAHVLLGLSRYGDLYCECELHREPRWVERAIDLAERWKPAELCAEGNNCMGLLLPAAEQILRERQEQKRPVVVQIRETIVTVPKVARIRRLNDYLKAGRLHVRNTAGGRMLVEQLRDFPSGSAHDDGPDALSTALTALAAMVNP
jgi:hypothetical protein